MGPDALGDSTSDAIVAIQKDGNKQLHTTTENRRHLIPDNAGCLIQH